MGVAEVLQQHRLAGVVYRHAIYLNIRALLWTDPQTPICRRFKCDVEELVCAGDGLKVSPINRYDSVAIVIGQLKIAPIKNHDADRDALRGGGLADNF